MSHTVRKIWWSAPLVGALLVGTFVLRVRSVASAAPSAPDGKPVARQESAPKPIRALDEGVVFTNMPTPAEGTPVEAAPFPSATPEIPAPTGDAATLSAKRHEPEPSEAARLEREELVTKLAASGPGTEQWRATLNQIERAWLELDHRAGLGVELSRWECYQAGCTTTVTLPDVASQERFRALAQSHPVMAAWKGAGFLSGPVRLDSGEIEVTWIFYAPGAS
jgi:hypothetical protein